MAKRQLNVRVGDEARRQLSELVSAYASEGKAVEAAIDLLWRQRPTRKIVKAVAHDRSRGTICFEDEVPEGYEVLPEK